MRGGPATSTSTSTSTATPTATATTRAAKSAFLNLCEGLPSDSAAIRRRYFTQADGSLHEAAGAIDLAAAIGAVDGATAAELQRLAVRLRSMFRGLLRPTGRAR